MRPGASPASPSSTRVDDLDRSDVAVGTKVVPRAHLETRRFAWKGARAAGSPPRRNSVSSGERESTGPARTVSSGPDSCGFERLDQQAGRRRCCRPTSPRCKRDRWRSKEPLGLPDARRHRTVGRGWPTVEVRRLSGEQDPSSVWPGEQRAVIGLCAEDLGAVSRVERVVSRFGGQRLSRLGYAVAVSAAQNGHHLVTRCGRAIDALREGTGVQRDEGRRPDEALQIDGQRVGETGIGGKVDGMGTPLLRPKRFRGTQGQPSGTAPKPSG